MTRTYFGMLFIVISVIILIALNQLNLESYFSTFSIVFLIAAYFAGQYSAKFPKEK